MLEFYKLTSLLRRQDTTPQPPGTVVPAPGVVVTVISDRTGSFVGARMIKTRVLYVFFDPQCPHCGRLWETAKPLLGQIRVVWVPVAFITAKSGRRAHVSDFRGPAVRTR